MTDSTLFEPLFSVVEIFDVFILKNAFRCLKSDGPSSDPLLRFRNECCLDPRRINIYIEVEPATTMGWISMVFRPRVYKYRSPT